MNFEQGRQVPTDSVLTADVCVIGSGAAGITLARQLSGSKLRVLIVEAGGLKQDRQTEDDCFKVQHVGVPYRNPIPSRGRWFGGSTNLWFGRIAVPDPIDFEERPWVPNSGWPVSYEQLQPWLHTASEILDVPNFEKIHLANWRANPTIDTFVTEGAANLGVFLWARGLTMASEHGRTIKDSANVRVLLEGTAVELVPNPDATLIESLTVAGPSGNRFSIQASTFVLAAGGLENPRLLLASRIRSAQGVGNDRDLVGRFLMDHPRGEGLATVDLRGLSTGQTQRLLLLGEKARTPYGKTQLRLTFPPPMQRDEELLNHSLHAHVVTNALSDSAAYQGARRLKRRLDGSGAEPGASLREDAVAALKGVPELAQFGVRRAARRARPTELVVIDQMEQEPDALSRVMLDPMHQDRFGLPRLVVDWRISLATYRSQRRMHEMFNEILQGAGIHTFRSQVLDRPGELPELLDMKHPMGTTRMSGSPATGVVDSNCRVHGVSNLYVAGSSVFPTGGHANPTLLIIALAARLADHIQRP